MATAEMIRTARAILRDFTNGYVAEGIEAGELDYNEAVAEAETMFLEDEEFKAAAAYELLHSMVPALIAQKIRGNRDLLPTARGAVTGKRIDKTARERLADRMESVGHGKYLSLLEMTRPQLRHVLDERKTRVAGELREIKFLTDLVKLYPDNDTPLKNIAAHRLDAVIKEHLDPPEPAE